MAKSNFLKQIRALDRKNEKYPYAVCTWWQACVFDEDEVDADAEGSGWLILGDGTLDECFEVLKTWISQEVDMEFQADGTAQRLSVVYDDEPQKYIAAWEDRQRQRREQIKEQCLMNGEYESEGEWFITSVLTPEEAVYEAKQRTS